MEGIYISRTIDEKLAIFSNDHYKPTPDDLTRLPSRPKQEQLQANRIEHSPYLKNQLKVKVKLPGHHDIN